MRSLNRIVFQAIITFISFISLFIGTAAAQTSSDDVILYASEATVRSGGWAKGSDSTAAGGYCMRDADAGAAKLTSPLANPTNYFELTFNAEAGRGYRLWIRGKAQNDYWGNDSVFVQFSGSVTASGAAVYRIGTTSAATVNLEDCSGCGLSGWGWQDNGWGAGVLGPLIYFADTGTQTLRIQTREDGLAIDQIVLSPSTYLNAAPGKLKNDTTILSSSIVIWAADVPSSGVMGNWTKGYDGAAAGQTALRHADAGAAKLTSPLANPTNYFQVNFTAEAGKGYRLWIRGKAQNDYWGNDSVFVQFSGSVTASGAAVYRIGTTSAATVNLEDCSGCGLSGWGWQDNGWGAGVLGPLIYFADTGTQTLRIQTREDGLAIDQIVLSPSTYLNAAPGKLKDDATILPSTNSDPPSDSVNQPPQVSISASPKSGTAPLSVSFSCSASDPDGYIASYSWSFGDGKTSSLASPVNYYQEAGTYTARLTVKDNDGATASASLTITVSSPTSSGARFKVLHWNVAWVKGTDTIYDINRQVNWMVNQSPQLISMNEVPAGDVDDYVSLMKQKTGVSWYSHYALNHPSRGAGLLILSRYPLISTGFKQLSYERAVIRVTVSIGGRNVNFFSTHLTPGSSATAQRRTQMSEMYNWASGVAEPRIFAGDFNLCPGWSDYPDMTRSYYDTWAEAMGDGTAVSYADNPDGKTRGCRIDYINYSKGATNLALIGVKMPDQRDLNNKNVVTKVGNSNDWGVRPSDHNFLVATFEIR